VHWRFEQKSQYGELQHSNHLLNVE
jgi:hypothetical protein